MSGIDSLVNLLNYYADTANGSQRDNILSNPSTYSGQAGYSNDAYNYPENEYPAISNDGRINKFKDRIKKLPIDRKPNGDPVGPYRFFWTRKVAFALAVCRPSYNGPIFVSEPPIQPPAPSSINGSEDWLKIYDDWARLFFFKYENGDTDKAMLKAKIVSDLLQSTSVINVNYGNYLIDRFWPEEQ